VDFHAEGKEQRWRKSRGGSERPLLFLLRIAFSLFLSRSVSVDASAKERRLPAWPSDPDDPNVEIARGRGGEGEYPPRSLIRPFAVSLSLSVVPVIFYCFLPTKRDPPPPPSSSSSSSSSPPRCSFYIDSPFASIVTRARVWYPYRFFSCPPLSLSLSLSWIVARIRDGPLLLPLLSLPRMRERARGL